MVQIVSLGGKYQVPCELGIPIDCTDTVQDIAKMKLIGFVSNVNVLALKRWAARQIINN